MDREYIQLCAEMAYNDVIIEEALKEDYLIESKAGEKIKNIIDNFISYCKMLWNKIVSFISKKIKEFKVKIEEIKKKKEEKKVEAKQESTSLYNQLMEMILIEEDEDQGKINWNYVYDIMYASYFSIVDSVSLKLHGMINDIDTILMNSIKKDIDKKEYDKIIDLIDEKTEVGFSVPTEFGNAQLLITKDTISTFNRNYNIIIERSRKIKDDEYNPKYTDYENIDKIENSFKSMEKTIQYYMKTVSGWSTKYNNEQINDLFEKLVSVCVRDCKKVLDNSSMLITTASSQLMQIKIRCEIEK